MTYSLASKSLQLFLIPFFLIMGCKSQESNYHDIIMGKWAYIDPEGQYCEMYIDHDQILSQPEYAIYHGPYDYTIVNNKIIFNNIPYYIEIIDCNSFRLSNSNFNLVFEKLHIDKLLSSEDVFYGFFLRRCNYLVNKGRLSIKEAYETLKAFSLNEFKGIEEKEEIIK